MPKQNRKPGIHLHKTIPRSQVRYEYFWILIAKNGKPICQSSKMHKTKRAAVKNISISAKLFAGSIGVTGGHYYDHANGGDLLNYDYK